MCDRARPRARPARGGLPDRGIPYALQRRRRFADTSIGRALIGALRCVGEGHREPPRRSALVAARAGMLERGELADRLELTARRTGPRRSAGEGDLGGAQLAAADARRAAEAAERGPVALIDRAESRVGRLFSAPRRRSASVLEAEDVAEAHAFRCRSASTERAARARPPRAGAGSESTQDLAELLADVDFIDGERPAPGLVAVLDPLGLRARRVRALFLCGMQEGVFPARGAHAATAGRGGAQAAG